jgi:proton-dependent oligopeptide transporter, POT family
VKVLGQDGKTVNQLLWDTYHPYTIWYIFSAIGVCSLVGMLLFSRASKRWKDMDV